MSGSERQAKSPSGALPVKVETCTTLDGSLRLCDTLPRQRTSRMRTPGTPCLARGKCVRWVMLCIEVVRIVSRKVSGSDTADVTSTDGCRVLHPRLARESPHSDRTRSLRNFADRKETSFFQRDVLDFRGQFRNGESTSDAQPTAVAVVHRVYWSNMRHEFPCASLVTKLHFWSWVTYFNLCIRDGLHPENCC